MACKYIYEGITYDSKEEFIEKVVLQEFPTLAGGKYAGVEDGMEFERINGLPSDLKGNQFLDLLAKDNNWVTFFIKSIISDSAKKGYEKVLFPTGNTASKVEGHTTLEEFKKQKEDRIKELEKQEPQYAFSTIEASSVFSSKISSQFIDDYNEELRQNAEKYKGKYIVVDRSLGNDGRVYGVNLPQDLKNIEVYNTKEEADKVAKSKGTRQDNEINQLKQELERVEREGFGALKPIFNFYENIVTNILNKTYGKENVKQITDEYGNTWNEIDLTILPKELIENIKLSSPDIQYTGDLAIEERLAEEFSEEKSKMTSNIWQQFVQWVKDMISLLTNKSDIDNLFRDIRRGKYRDIQPEFNNTLYSIEQSIKPGVPELFGSNPELASIGTEQQYSQYLDTIFPDSKVKDIVYHGSPKTKLEKIEGISFWTNEIGNAYSYNIQRNEDNSEGFVTSAIVNIKNPHIHQEDVNSRFATTTPKNLIDTAKSKNADGAIWKDVEDVGGKETQTVVFEPEQIHILGSKQDIQGFKDFIDIQNGELPEIIPTC